MVREFSDVAGQRWTASESGFYVGEPDLPEHDGFVEDILAGVKFRRERGQHGEAQ